MNTNEIKELRGQIKPGAKRLYISNLATAYITNINAVPTIKSFQIRHFDDLSEEDQVLYTKMLKKVMSGQLGRNLMEYRFNKSSDPENESGPQKVMYALNANRLESEELVRNFIDKIAKATTYVNGYYVTIAACEYNIPVIDKNDEELAGSSNGTHRFLILAINEISPADLGLYYNEDENIIERKIDNDLHVLPAAQDGLVFPAFTDRASDINHFLYYTKNAKKPNDALLDILLDVETAPTYDEEKDAFAALIEDVAGEELTLDMYKKIYNNVRDVVIDEESEDLATLSKQDLEQIFAGSGIPDQQMQLFSASYTNAVGEHNLTAVNAIDAKKINIKAADVNVTIKPEAAYKVKTQMIDGGLYLCIAIDDGLVVNGMDVHK